jgi:hypothetical protein
MSVNQNLRYEQHWLVGCSHRSKGWPYQTAAEARQPSASSARSTRKWGHGTTVQTRALAGVEDPTDAHAVV